MKVTKKEVHQRALSILAARRQKALEIEQVHRQHIAQKIPQVIQLEQQMSSCVIELTRQVLSKTSDLLDITPQMIDKNLQTQAQITQMLSAHGFAPDYLTPPYTCTQCNDTGFHDAQRCSCLKVLVHHIYAQEAYHSLGMPDCQFDDFSLDYYTGADYQQMCQVLTFCKEYAQRFSAQAPSILMIGNTGLGKTHLAAAIAKQVLNDGYTMIYLHAHDFFTRVQQEQFGKSTLPVSTFTSALQADLLILDDLGAEYDSAFHAASFYNLINSRLQAKKPMIITSSLSLKAIEKRYGDRAGSRLMTLCKCLKFCGTDIRQLKLTQSR